MTLRLCGLAPPSPSPTTTHMRGRTAMKLHYPCSDCQNHVAQKRINVGGKYLRLCYFCLRDRGLAK